jgi:phosphopantothenoylcysteine decarboxylase/phosphopantothenate--cysteine ligase
MRCLVTAGPTYEPLDAVRRLTNFSTGRLGTELADYLTAKGHDTELLLGEQATWGGGSRASKVERFSTTADLQDRFLSRQSVPPDAIFHAAAVSDYAFGKVYSQTAAGELMELRAGKIATREGRILAELVPTPKILSQLRGWFPKTVIVGWKYEVDGSRVDAIARGIAQIRECRIDVCVVNGPAYGAGFGLLTSAGEQCPVAGPEELFEALEKHIRASPGLHACRTQF